MKVQQKQNQKTFKPTARERMCLAAIKVYAKNAGHWLDSTEIGQLERQLIDDGFTPVEMFKAITQAHIEELF